MVMYFLFSSGPIDGVFVFVYVVLLFSDVILFISLCTHRSRSSGSRTLNESRNSVFPFLQPGALSGPMTRGAGPFGVTQDTYLVSPTASGGCISGRGVPPRKHRSFGMV